MTEMVTIRLPSCLIVENLGYPFIYHLRLTKVFQIERLWADTGRVEEVKQNCYSFNIIRDDTMQVTIMRRYKLTKRRKILVTSCHSPQFNIYFHIHDGIFGSHLA
jgi:hypothetical protein